MTIVGPLLLLSLALGMRGRPGAGTFVVLGSVAVALGIHYLLTH